MAKRRRKQKKRKRDEDSPLGMGFGFYKNEEADRYGEAIAELDATGDPQVMIDAGYWELAEDE